MRTAPLFSSLGPFAESDSSQLTTRLSKSSRSSDFLIALFR